MAPIDLQRPRDLGRILDDAFALYRAHWRALLAAAAVVVVPAQVAVYGVGLGWLTGHYDSSQPAGATVAGLLAQLLVVTPLVTAMAVRLVQGASRGERPSASVLIQGGLAAFSALLPAVALAALGIVVGLFALLIPGLVLAVRWALVAQVVVVEDERGGAALRRSALLSTGRGWFVFVVLVVTNVLVSVLSLVATLPLDVAARSADVQGLSLLGQTLGQVFALPILAVAQTLLYFSLRAEKDVPPARVPEPEPAIPEALPGVPGTYGAGFEPPLGGR